jgi:hypothetical protein
MNRIKTTVFVIVLGFSLITATLLFLISPSFAYFRTAFDKQGVNTVMVELIFDRLDFNNTKIKEAGFANEENGVEVPWGSKKNPYVISQKYHIQNLSVLQNSGFFAGRLENDENGNAVPSQSYFLVCNPDGTPITIDCEGMSISPIGTHQDPFTGVIEGAPISGTCEYKSYGTSVSTIANLKVESKLDEPDIGFFGRLGYSGELDSESLTVSDGFAAKIDNLVFADITIISKKSLIDSLKSWWDSFLNHFNHSEDKQETHHIGVIAGHAEFATVKNISVYYSENVEAFNLVSDDEGSNTNYYSSTGLIGLLQYVNPIVKEDGTIDGSNAITDSDVIGDGSSGAGGDESGTLTGYFLAKNLFDRHEAYLTKKSLPKSNEYNVMEMKDADETELFKTVTMRERASRSEDWEYRNYFYFQDTVFTFAMSMSVEATQNGESVGTLSSDKIDYIKTIWAIDEDNRPSLSATDSFDKLQFGPDPTTAPQISYYLEAVTSLSDGGYYVLAYLDKMGTDDTADDTLYILDLTKEIDGNGLLPMRKVPAEEIYTDAVYSGGNIHSISLVGTTREYYDYAFRYDKSNGTSIKKPTNDEKLGITATGNIIEYSTPVITISTSNATNGSIGGDAAYFFDWNFVPHTDGSPLFAISATYRFGSQIIINNYTYGYSKLTFENGSVSFSSTVDSKNDIRNDTISYDDSNYFTVFRVNTNTFDDNGNITNEKDTDNKLLSPKNILPTAKEENGELVPDTIYDFDPSKYVLQYVGTSQEGGYSDINNYRLLPIRSLKLNNGKGDLLTEVNHIAKLYKTHNENYQLQIGNVIGGNIGNWINDRWATNSGGVLNTTIGTKNLSDPDNPDNLYSIPTGMIAFEINEASSEKPSYINIIVAVNPGLDNGVVGLWAMNKESWKQKFSLAEPPDSFELPISKSAISATDRENIIKITERVIEKEDEDGKKTYITVLGENAEAETSYMYLGGKEVLVYHRFEITKTGVYMLGSQQGPLSVAYFSVSGAAGEGEDGMSGSPLGNIDFVYDYNGEIITTDKQYTEEEQILSEENYEQYYPSYLFISMLPEQTKIQHEVIKIRRYIKSDDSSGTKRHLSLTGQNYTEIRSVSLILQDMQDDLD